MSKTLEIKMRVDEEFKNLVQELAEREYSTMTYIIKKAVREYSNKVNQPLKREVTPRKRHHATKE